MAQTLTVYLVNQAGDLRGLFDAGKRKACADALQAYLSGIIRGVAQYDAVNVTWDGKAGQPTARDFVCYALTSAKDSIAAGKASGDVTLGVSGSTLWSVADRAVVSEVYLRQIVQGGLERGLATPNAERVVANCMLHEMAHALLDASTPVVIDVHKVKGGVICRETDAQPLSDSDRPNGVDTTTFQTGFSRRGAGVKPYTGAMPA